MDSYTTNTNIKTTIMKKPLCVGLFLLFSIATFQAQSISQFVVANSGETISGGSGTLSFTLGEPVIGDIANGPSMGQGFWLGAIEGVVLGVDDFTSVSATTVYPNPVWEELSISFSDILGEDFSIAFYDITGRKIMQRDVTKNQATEVMYLGALASGTYLLRVTRLNGGHSKSFKIIKR